jgi:hypothetical protein
MKSKLKDKVENSKPIQEKIVEENKDKKIEAKKVIP